MRTKLLRKFRRGQTPDKYFAKIDRWYTHHLCRKWADRREWDRWWWAVHRRAEYLANHGHFGHARETRVLLDDLLGRP